MEHLAAVLLVQSEWFYMATLLQILLREHLRQKVRVIILATYRHTNGARVIFNDFLVLVL